MTTRTSTDRTFSNLDWPLVLSLGAVALVRPLLSILGISTGRPWVSVLVTLAITALWIASAVRWRVQNPLVTLALVGGTYGVLAIVINVAIQGDFSKLPAVALVAIPVTNVIWGGIAGAIAAAIRRA